MQTKNSVGCLLLTSSHKQGVIPDTADLRQFNPALFGTKEDTRAAVGFAPNELAILMLARLEPSEGHSEAIRAVTNLQETLPVRLYLVGAGPEEPALRRLVADLSALVEFMGIRRDVPQLLYAADIFVFPAHGEGLPFALIEELSAGGGSVAYIPIGDVARLTLALYNLCQDFLQSLSR